MQNLEWHDDRVIDLDTGRTFALSVPWAPNYPALAIPACLMRDPNDKTPWTGWDGTITPWVDPREQRQIELRAALAEDKKRKKAAGLKALKDKHPGQVYDRKKRRWVTAAVTEE